ncbi:hypothetical protein ACH4NF_33875 [Streptomyces sp. NPDC017248]|uniref:hypothetical protein n=1 Tax=unclassified Streptomyces TaxID=2593676 RepID=UPI0037B2DB4E
MNVTFGPRRGRRAGASIAVSALLLALASCSGEGQQREYSTPRSACGTAIDAAALADFLPPGEKVSTKVTATSPKATRCAVSVDGTRVVYTAQEWWSDMSVLEFAKGLTLEKVGHRTDDGRFAYSGNQAFGKTEGCRNKRDQILYTAVLATGSKHSDAAAMKKLITTYTAAVERSSVCQ